MGGRLTNAEDQSQNRDKDSGGQQGDYVTGQHGVVGAGGFDVDDAVVEFRSCDEPGDDAAAEPKNGAEGSGPEVLTLPHQCKCSWQDSRGYNNPHEQVQISHADTGIMKTSGKCCHHKPKAHHTYV
jgi:hypothetical protein